MRALPLLLAFSACAYDPHPGSGQTLCGPNNECPQGWTCMNMRCFGPDAGVEAARPDGSSSETPIDVVSRPETPTADTAADAPVGDGSIVPDAPVADSNLVPDVQVDSRPPADVAPDLPPDRAPDLSPDACTGPPRCEGTPGTGCNGALIYECKTISGCLTTTEHSCVDPGTHCEGAYPNAACVP
jgi:hypothetical protein